MHWANESSKLSEDLENHALPFFYLIHQKAEQGKTVARAALPHPNVHSQMDLHGLICQRSRFLHASRNNLHAGCLGHRQSTNMQFTLWDDLICYMIEKMPAWFCMESEWQESKSKMREFFSTANADNYQISECPLVHLCCTS